MVPPPTNINVPRADQFSDTLLAALRRPADNDTTVSPSDERLPMPRDLPPVDELQKWLDLSG